MNHRRLTIIPAIRLQVYCNPAPVPRCCPWNVSVPIAFIAPYPIYVVRKLIFLISQPLQHTHICFQTHISIERVYNIPQQQVIRRFSSCGTDNCDTADRCTGRRKRLTVSMDRPQKLRYLPVNITVTRFLPRKGNSTRYPPNKDAGMPTDVWMSS